MSLEEGDMMKNWILNYKVAGVILLLTLGFLLVPQIAAAQTYDFKGTVFFDSQTKNSYQPGLGNDFSGSLSLTSDGSLSFYNNCTEKQYCEPGTVTTGQFTLNEIDYLYAYSQGSEGSPRMGLLWWSDPMQLDIFGYEVKGLAFYLEGYNYIPAYFMDQIVNKYIAKGDNRYLPSDNFQPQYSDGQVKYGKAFLGLVTDPFVVKAEPSAVPLPAPIWFLGSGLALLWRRNKKQQSNKAQASS
ncbi:MAG: hypothetical protein J7L25_06775 [Deltaproteobacteria bacterium]|nr:hypothetical protein [Candidatus Tharpella aukensis]